MKIGILNALPLSEFAKSKFSKDGLQYKCKDCTKQYYQDNKEAIDEYRKQYDQDNKESKLEHYKQYYQDNKESIAQYRLDNKEDITEYQRQLYMSEGYGVYTLTHLLTQCYYVGEGQLYKRRIAHFNDLKRGKNKCGHIQEHYNKHPNIDDWEFKVLKKWEHINKDEGLYFENILIKEGLDKHSAKILNKKVGIGE